MEQSQRPASARKKAPGRPASQKQPGDAQCHGVLAKHWYSMARSARTVWPVQSIPCMDKGRRMGERPEQPDSAGYRR